MRWCEREALDVASRLADDGENTDVLALAVTRAAQTRIAVFRGQAPQTASVLDWLESTSRGAGAPEYMVIGLVSSALARAALGQGAAAAALLAEVEATPGVRAILYYAAYLPAMVRTALSVADTAFAERLSDGVEPRNPCATHALATVRAALAESRGEQQAAAEGYAHAAECWHHFGVLPEHALALLGQGRSLTALRRTAEAIQPLQRARKIFQTLQAAGALVQTERLLRGADALSA